MQHDAEEIMRRATNLNYSLERAVWKQLLLWLNHLDLDPDPSSSTHQNVDVCSNFQNLLEEIDAYITLTNDIQPSPISANHVTARIHCCRAK